MKSHSVSKIPLLFIIITVNSLISNHSRISTKVPDLFPWICGYVFSSSPKELLPIISHPMQAKESCTVITSPPKTSQGVFEVPPHFPLPSVSLHSIHLLSSCCSFHVLGFPCPFTPYHTSHNQMIFSISLHSHSIPSLSGTFLMAASTEPVTLSPNCVLSFPGNRNSVV